jgi:hypothetical protein
MIKTGGANVSPAELEFALPSTSGDAKIRDSDLIVLAAARLGKAGGHVSPTLSDTL